MRFGITLSNRGILLGLTTVRGLLELADAVEANPLLDSLWAGDALFANPRLDAFTLLAALAGRTNRVRLGPACMGSFALRDPRVFAAQWASLDVLSGGRTRLAVCAGGGGEAWERESAAMGIPPAERRRRMIENIAAVRHLWTQDEAPFEGEFIRFSGITLLPKPLQVPCPIWLTTNAGRLSTTNAGRLSTTNAGRLSNAQVDAGGSPFALKRTGQVVDGWMTHSVSPDGFRRSLDMILDAGTAAGRDMSGFETILCHHIHIAEDADAALADAKRYLDLYYGANYTAERLRAWGVYGPPAECIAQLRRYRDCGCDWMTLRLATTGDVMAQFRRLVEDVLPHLG